MGIEPVHFGSVFLYKNGFRIAPYGDNGFDYFGLDTRKAQKHFDLLGSRDLIGRIEIIGDNPDFKEISSRDGGLVRNDHYKTMVKCFIDQCLKKLENYLNKVQWTNKEDKDREDLSALNNIIAKSALLKLVSDEVDDDETDLLDADRLNLNIRAQELISTASTKDIESLKKIANKLGDNEFVSETKEIANEHEKILQLQSDLLAQGVERQRLEDEKKKLESELTLEREKNTYLRTSSRSLSEDAKGLVHNIKHTSKQIKSSVDHLYDAVRTGKTKEKDIISKLISIRFNIDKVLKIASLITRANFKSDVNHQTIDVVKYILQYVSIYGDIFEKNQLSFTLTDNDSSYIKRVSALDIALVIDDLISNAQKAGADNIEIFISMPSESILSVQFSDDGSGVEPKFIKSPESMFELGITTTDGSGIGLHSVRKTLANMQGEIKFLGNNLRLNGATFEIIFKK
jgi:signal transduction histidine kinase